MRKDHLAAFAAILVITVFLLAVYFPAFARPPEAPSPELSAVVEAERAFARLSVAEGMKAAFLANLASDAVVFRPGPVPAVAWFRDRPAADGVLSWEPDFAAVSAEGDLGYTSGPWEYRDKGATEGVHGHYVTLWRRQADGTFKVAIDTGVRHDKPTGAVSLAYARSAALTAQPARSADAAAESMALLEADRSGARDAVSRPWLEVWMERAATDIRLYRPGAFPVIGKDGVRAALGARAGSYVWSPVAAGCSRAGDLGYTYGTCEFRPSGARPDSVEASSYVRIWRQRADGRREIVLDVAAPMPPPAPKP